jgi:predicted oxidoreductase (fatty acid repression mutant protein)
MEEEEWEIGEPWRTRAEMKVGDWRNRVGRRKRKKDMVEWRGEEKRSKVT